MKSYQMSAREWRGQCLCVILVVLLLIVMANLALTLWIMNVLDFNMTGIGRMRVVRDGLVLDGDSWILGRLIASQLRSRINQPLHVRSSRNFSVLVQNQAQQLAAQLVLDEQGLDVRTNNFRVIDRTGTVVFSASPSEVLVGAHTLRVTGEGGAVFDGSVETSAVRARAGQDLKLESATRSLEISAPLGVSIESRAGDISATCLRDLKLQSTGGMIRLDSSKVLLPQLPVAVGSSRAQLAADITGPAAFQLCACNNGKLFLVPPDGACVADILTCS